MNGLLKSQLLKKFLLLIPINLECAVLEILGHKGSIFPPEHNISIAIEALFITLSFSASYDSRKKNEMLGILVLVSITDSEEKIGLLLYNEEGELWV